VCSLCVCGFFLVEGHPPSLSPATFALISVGETTGSDLRRLRLPVARPVGDTLGNIIRRQQNKPIFFLGPRETEGPAGGGKRPNAGGGSFPNREKRAVQSLPFRGKKISPEGAGGRPVWPGKKNLIFRVPGTGPGMLEDSRDPRNRGEYGFWWPATICSIPPPSQLIPVNWLL